MRTSRFLTGTVAAILLMGASGGAALAQAPEPAPTPKPSFLKPRLTALSAPTAPFKPFRKKLSPT